LTPNNGEKYTGNMDIALEFNSSAFKHGISEEDIRTAIERFVYIWKTMRKTSFAWF